VVLDAAGNVYGTTFGGGTGSCFFGCGVVFKLRHGSNGKWTETILHSFTGGTDGGDPYAGLTFEAGKLYGTTNFGGSPSCSSGCGVVFRLTKGGNGMWTETVLQSFSGNDGEVPYGNVIVDAAGNLYGTTLNGGTAGYGVIFKVTP
jgi:uncharacterized repeat protein (TIGR03803 family)